MVKIYLNYLSGLGRVQKKALLLFIDACMLPLLMWFAFAIRLFNYKTPVMAGLSWWPILVIVLGISCLWLTGVYRAVIRSFNENFILRLAFAVILNMLALYVVAKLRLAFVPMSIPIIFASLLFAWVWCSRAFIRIVINNTLYNHTEKTRVAIYGAGNAGQQMALALDRSPNHIPVLFLDDHVGLQGQMVQGLKVYSPRQLNELKQRFHLHEILLAIPSIGRQRKMQVIQQLESLALKVREVPSVEQIIDGQLHVSDIREVDIETLLGREPVPPNVELLDKNIRDKVVLVTGAGGSIGSELCRQILQRQPKLLILFEQSEFSLYSIHQELQQRHQVLIPILGSVFNEKKLTRIMQQYQVQTVYHAAAYKHVPLVEANPIEGLRNNSVGTAKSLNAAVTACVETFVLISTDKAVRPTNVMGASKRLAELYCQAMAASQPKTQISIVRFGNVLGSSGSVVPLFKKQIAAGGPITVTHPDVTRYFMTIPEAALLVIQAGAMGEGGDVFLLDMGESVRIRDLALQMIALSGLKLKEGSDDEGDIEIHYTGLRPGEKLYEELLIEQGNVQPTAHERIVKSYEKQFALEQIKILIDLIQHSYTHRDDLEVILEQLERYVDGYKRSDQVVVS